MLTGEEIYSWVKGLPIVDWHNHLDIRAIAEDRPFGSLYEVWVKADPYKHRAMRICGVPERLITGDAPEAEKWAVWNATLPKLVGNPLYVWSQAELKFLESHPLESLTPQKMLRAFGVAYTSPCVTAQEIDAIAAECRRLPADLHVVPSLRLNFGDEIPSAALEKFAAAGCKVVDVSVDDPSALADALPGQSTNPPIEQSEQSNILNLFSFAASHGWTVLLHIGAMRSTSARLRAASGPVGGFAGMRAPCDPKLVSDFLNGLEQRGALPRTILLTLNPEAHAQLAILSGSFVEDGVPGKVQLGPAWWWCDHKDGILDVFEKNAAYSVLSVFVGMTTDSRSFLSLARHDYFRRLLADWMAKKVAEGEFPDDASVLRPIAEDVCYGNAAARFCS